MKRGTSTAQTSGTRTQLEDASPAIQGKFEPGLYVFESVVRIVASLLLLTVALPALGRIAVTRPQGARRGIIDIAADNEPLSAIVTALRPLLTRPVAPLAAATGERQLTFAGKGLSPSAALAGAVAAAGAQLRVANGRFFIEAPRSPSVTLDVKDADLRLILKDMQKQCGVRNLIMDRDVQGSGTFLFHDVPCRTAFEMVLRVNGLELSDDTSAVVSAVRKRDRLH